MAAVEDTRSGRQQSVEEMQTVEDGCHHCRSSREQLEAVTRVSWSPCSYGNATLPFARDPRSSHLQELESKDSECTTLQRLLSECKAQLASSAAASESKCRELGRVVEGLQAALASSKSELEARAEAQLQSARETAQSMQKRHAEEIHKVRAEMQEFASKRAGDVQLVTSKYETVLHQLSSQYEGDMAEMQASLVAEASRHERAVEAMAASHAVDLSSLQQVSDLKVRLLTARLESLQEQMVMLADVHAPSADEVAASLSGNQVLTCLQELQAAIPASKNNARLLQDARAALADQCEAMRAELVRRQHLSSIAVRNSEVQAGLLAMGHTEKVDELLRSVVGQYHEQWQQVLEGCEGSSMEPAVMQAELNAARALVRTCKEQTEALERRAAELRAQVSKLGREAFEAHCMVLAGSGSDEAGNSPRSTALRGMRALQAAYRAELRRLERDLRGHATSAVRQAVTAGRVGGDTAVQLLAAAASIHFGAEVAAAESAAGLADGGGSRAVILPTALSLATEIDQLARGASESASLRRIEQAEAATKRAEAELQAKTAALQSAHEAALQTLSASHEQALAAVKAQSEQQVVSLSTDLKELQRDLEARQSELEASKGALAECEAQLEESRAEAKEALLRIRDHDATVAQVMENVKHATEAIQDSANETVAHAVAHSAAAAAAQRAVASAASGEVKRLKAMVADLHNRLRQKERQAAEASVQAADVVTALKRERQRHAGCREEVNTLASQLHANRQVIADLLLKTQAYAAAHGLEGGSGPTTPSPSKSYAEFAARNGLGSQPKSPSAVVRSLAGSTAVKDVTGSLPSPTSPWRSSPTTRSLARTSPQPRRGRGSSPATSPDQKPASPSDTRRAKDLIRGHILRTDSVSGLGHKRYDVKSKHKGFGTVAVRRTSLLLKRSAQKQ